MLERKIARVAIVSHLNVIECNANFLNYRADARVLYLSFRGQIFC